MEAAGKEGEYFCHIKNKPCAAVGAVSKVSFFKGLFCSDRKVVEEGRGNGTENAVSLGLGFYSSLFFRIFCNSVSQVYLLFQLIQECRFLLTRRRW